MSIEMKPFRIATNFEEKLPRDVITLLFLFFCPCSYFLFYLTNKDFNIFFLIIHIY